MAKNSSDLYIIKKTMLGTADDYVLKLNRNCDCLEVFKRVESEKTDEYYSIKEDFDLSSYAVFEIEKVFPCIKGGNTTPTPIGIFNVEEKSKKEYISRYHPKYDKVKFFGYLVIFEDYFIHSDMYMLNVDEYDIRHNENLMPISKEDECTSGCIRVSQENLDWLLENIETGTTVIL